MKLRTKLLLGVGLLLFLMVIVMYILPTFFVRRDVYAAADQIHTLLIKEHRKLIQSQKLWLDNELERTIQNINSILFMISEQPDFSKSLTFAKNNSLLNVWEGLTRVLGYDPEIGFIQAHSPEAKQTVVVSSHTAKLYQIGKIRDHEGMAIIGMETDEGKGEQKVLFVGMPLPETFQREKEYTLYALLDIRKVAEEKAEFLKEIKELASENVDLHLQDADQFVFKQVEGDPSAYFWAIKIDMIRTLAPLILEGFLIEHSDTKYIPTGIGRLDSSGTGVGLLAEDAFQGVPLFDDRNYFETHPPKPGDPPLADGSVLVTKPVGNHAFIANTLLIDNTFLSIGVSFRHLIRQLALSSNKTILLNVNKGFWMGFDGNGQKIPLSEIEDVLKSGLVDQSRGMLKIGEKAYFYGRISSLDLGNLVFYELHPIGGEESILSTLLALEDKLSGRISMQLSLISLGTMILVLLFVGRIGFTVIYPVTKLAQATEDVVAGRYQDVSLPEVGRRRDEVAVLIHSFAAMVNGLQEREKIRGVLDKVVSKDVADEILRTQIHLGGEDRIVTMLFSDIRGFTEITENVTPQKTIEMLNGCMTKISRVIEGEGGVIDKYVGDEVMAIYGAPALHPDHALRAVSSGMLMIETLKRWNQERIQQGEPVLEMGIGVHTGLVVAGNMGAEDRLNYTVLGSSVNLASRLCQVARANQLIISEATLSEPNVEESFFVKPLKQIALKGFKEPVSIYEVVGFKWEET